MERIPATIFHQSRVVGSGWVLGDHGLHKQQTAPFHKQTKDTSYGIVPYVYPMIPSFMTLRNHCSPIPGPYFTGHHRRDLEQVYKVALHAIGDLLVSVLVWTLGLRTAHRTRFENGTGVGGLWGGQTTGHLRIWDRSPIGGLYNMAVYSSQSTVLQWLLVLIAVPYG